MRYYNYKDMYNYFLKDMYKNPTSMLQSFLNAEKSDKDFENENKTYVRKLKLNKSVCVYEQADINEYLKFQQEKFNTIIYAKNLLFDLELLYERAEISGYKGVIAKIADVYQTVITYPNFDYDVALRIINNIKKLFMNVDVETVRSLRKELKLIYDE
jgi:hypothetical protein